MFTPVRNSILDRVMLASKFRPYLKAIVFLLVVLMTHAIYPVVNFSRPISGRVVNADTGLPIEGAVILATWTVRPFMTEGAPLRNLVYLEAVTDSDGRYQIPGWGPVFNFGPGRLQADRDPTLRYIARGFMPAIEFNGSFPFDGRNMEYASRSIARPLRPVRPDEWERYAEEIQPIAIGSYKELPGCTGSPTPLRNHLVNTIINDLRAQHVTWSLSMCPEVVAGSLPTTRP